MWLARGLCTSTTCAGTTYIHNFYLPPGTMYIHNFYLPPNGSRYVSMNDIERLSEVCDMSVGGLQLDRDGGDAAVAAR